MTAAFVEFAYSPTDSIELSAAARYDDYSWTGLDSASGEEAGSSDSAGTYMLGASWRPIENLMLRASYGNENYERLLELKRKYDPSNLFRLNQNIAPG